MGGGGGGRGLGEAGKHFFDSPQVSVRVPQSSAKEYSAVAQNQKVNKRAHQTKPFLEHTYIFPRLALGCTYLFLQVPIGSLCYLSLLLLVRSDDPAFGVQNH